LAFDGTMRYSLHRFCTADYFLQLSPKLSENNLAKSGKIWQNLAKIATA